MALIILKEVRVIADVKISEIIEDVERPIGVVNRFSETMRAPKNFAAWSKVSIRDPNARQQQTTFTLYTKDQIIDFLSRPAANEKNLRGAAIYMYVASPHFRRIIQYFVGLSDLSHIIIPTRLGTTKSSAKTMDNNYRKSMNLVEAMSPKEEFPKILTVCLREDVFYGTIWETSDSVTIQRLPSDYCMISSIEGNVFNCAFDFSYFDTDITRLAFFPQEFSMRYEDYKKNRSGMKWQELNSPNSFAIKCNADIPEYAIPPFASILPEVYDIAAYKALKLAKTEIENYAMIDMRLEMNDEGEYILEFDKAKEFWKNLDAVLPGEIGSVLSPMELKKISFDRSTAGDADTTAEAERELFTAAGVSSLLFNNDKASANALMLSIMVDQCLTYGIVKSIQGMVNRFLQSKSFGRNFKASFIDVSPFNRKEAGDRYLKACQYGIPMSSIFSASQGMSQSDMEAMNYLENEVLKIHEKFIPLQSSATQSSDEGGRPESDIGDLTDAGEASREGTGDD